MQLYDDFNGSLIDSDRWHGVEVSEGAFLETTRKIQGNRILFVSRSIGLPRGNTGDSNGNIQIRTRNPVKALEATVVVDKYDLVDCPTNAIRSQMRARLRVFSLILERRPRAAP